MSAGSFCFAIDRGGTFTDVYARCPGGKVRVMKLLSEDPAYSDAPREAIRRILEEETDQPSPRHQPVNVRCIDWVRMGTTVATNALLERRGEPCALLISRGYADLLDIGNQARPHIFDLEVVKPDVLFTKVVEVDERVVLSQERCCLSLDKHRTKVGLTGETVHILEDVNLDKLRVDLQDILSAGIKSLSVVLMHSYTFSDHEVAVGHLARQMGFTHVSLSSDVMPMVRIVPRGYTACADAYLTPCIYRYVQSFLGGFSNHLESSRVLFMQSDGGLTPVDKFSGSKAILSGPAGGVVGYALTTFSQQSHQPVIGFDMGGTSTDVSRYDGEYEHVFESTTAGITVQAPQLDINTVAAGGGSRLFFRSGLFVVGPESAGAHPGPVCYGKGGPLAVTDANLCLGRLLPEHFPKIFGPHENAPLDKAATLEMFDQLTEEVNVFLSSQSGQHSLMTREQVAMGFLDVANEAMCRPIRALTQGKGYDTAHHVLACFGGAGGQHACAIARSLGMKTVFIHRYAGILSAYGMALADVVHEEQQPCAMTYNESSFVLIDDRLDTLTADAVTELERQGFKRCDISSAPYLHLRYRGTDCALMCGPTDTSNESGCRHGDFKKTFLERYAREFGFTLVDREVIVDDIRVRATARSGIDTRHEIDRGHGPAPLLEVTKCYFESCGFVDTSVYDLSALGAGHSMSGPAILISANSTIVVEPGCVASITSSGDISIQVGEVKKKTVGTELDAIQLSIFSHRFMSIAEQMGRVLQRTAISTNIKERLDFSCAVFGPDGGLVANAPHIPVHLGAMQETVQYQMRLLGGDLHEGDAILCNHPSAGGSHLPDLTVITPVFYPAQDKPVFFVACRGHHADIGGITPGSMPPHSHSLLEEGMCVKSFKLVNRGVFQEQGLIELLMEPGKLEGSSGTRTLSDNLSDLRAQVAANQKGIALVQHLIDTYGLLVVQAYMNHIQSNAEVAVREMLREIADKALRDNGCAVLEAVDYLDDGSPICLRISIDSGTGSALFDFTGTGPEVYGNCNAPRAVVLSAIIYCLRCMVGHDVPLNQGCLAPVEVRIPPGSLLSPCETAAVVGGNVLTSQRLVDVVFKAFQVCAASQGCMNNITFGDEFVGYYETVAGGAGAGPHWHGHSGVHTHMTNTRITDPEILERRYPVILKQFSLRAGTGGRGRFRGGDGVVRELLFRRPLTLSVLTERRAFRPYGLKGGDCGAAGQNLIKRSDGRLINIGGKVSINVQPGDTFELRTPGGGGYGHPETPGEFGEDEEVPAKQPRLSQQYFTARGSVEQYRLIQESA